MVGEFFGGSARRIRDDVWGEIPVDKAVRTLLETAVMSRLKGMNALGFASFAFPAAEHTRFDHAVGVYHLRRLTLRRIIDSCAYLEDRDVRTALAAALLHDVGRNPYTSELEVKRIPATDRRD